jgi:hypothetical protein
MERALSGPSEYLKGNKVEAYGLHMSPDRPDLYVLGSYRSVCGGMDTVGDAATGIEMVERYALRGDVLHEGLLQSTYYGAPGKASEQYGDRYVFAFLDTPIDICLERVCQRRGMSNSTNKFDPTLTIQKHETILRLKDRLNAMGRRVVTLKYYNAVNELEAIYASR